MAKPLKIGVGATALAMLSVIGYSNFASTESRDASLNAHLSAVRAPVSGYVRLQAADGAGVRKGDTVAEIRNPLADQSSLAEIERSLALAEAEHSRLLSQIDAARAEHDRILERAKAYAEVRSSVTEASVLRAQAALDEARASAEVARKRAVRYTELKKSGAASPAALSEAEGDAKRADALVALRHADLAEAGALAAAAAKGLSASGDTDGMSLYRAEDLAYEAVRLSRAAEEAFQRVQAAKRRLETEKERYQKVSEASLAAAASGLIWKSVARDGEWVEAGSVVAYVADCSTPMATAMVSDRAFNRLSVGQESKVSVVGSGRSYKATVAALPGAHGVDGVQWAVPLVARESERANAVTLAINAGPDAPDACAPGRAVNIAFD